jgi:DNA-directed RNA polymerase subunit F
MILEMRPLNLSEVKELAGDLDERKELRDYLKRFGKLSKVTANKLSEELAKLGNLKIKNEHIAKIVDFLPKNTVDLGKIFSDVSLDEKETNDVLEIVKGY